MQFMKVEIDPKKSIFENAATYFELAKKLKAKAEAAKKEIEKTKAEIEKAKKEGKKRKKKEEERKKGWYEQFRWFFTSDGFLAIGGKNAKQNYLLVKKYFTKPDLFFHADIHGGSVVILKNGTTAPQQSLKEAAQWAACYSNAWQGGISAVDVYCAGKEQVKTAAPSGQYLPKGSFLIEGKKNFLKNIPLGLYLGTIKGNLQCVPKFSGEKRFDVCFELSPGERKKEEVAEEMAKGLNIKSELLLGFVPSRTAIKRIK